MGWTDPGSGALAVQDSYLRRRKPTGFVRALPPLMTMEALLFEMIGLGFILLTLALFSGFLFLEDMFAQRLVHKTILSIVAWLVFGTLLGSALMVAERLDATVVNMRFVKPLDASMILSLADSHALLVTLE